MHNTTTETTYRQELKERILVAALNLFHKHGIKRVKMDDIANVLKISKRTLYEIYSNKEELLFEVIRLDKKKEGQAMAEIDKSGQNVINIIIEVCRFCIEKMGKINPLFFEELHMYPELLAYVRKLHKEYESDAHSFIQRGVKEGLFLPNINYEIIRILTVASQNAIMNQFLYKKYDVEELGYAAILFFVRGYCTLEGIKLLDKELDSLFSHK